jgi:hypothetical protein
VVGALRSTGDQEHPAVGIEHVQKKMGSISTRASQCHIRVVEDNGCLIVDVSPPPPEQERVAGSLEFLSLGTAHRQRAGSAGDSLSGE